MASVKLLDCTLRDGGYINNWEFGNKNIYAICERLISANIDIVEVGFMTDLFHEEGQSLYNNENELRKVIPKMKGNTRYAAMIALGEKEMNPEGLQDEENSLIDIVRLTFHNEPTEQNRAIEFARILMEKGYLVCMQPVGTTTYSDEQLIDLIQKINELNPFAFYLVDTLGCLYKQELLRLLYLIDHNLKSGICIGFHSHNNIQMSFANAQEIAEFPSQRQFIVDSSVYGMGRGAGNLCTEIAAEFLNRTANTQYNIFPLMEVVDECLIPIYLNNPWGYSAGYFLSSIRNCHPKYSSYLLSKQTLRVRDIGKILNEIPLKCRHTFDKNLIKKLYLAFQENEIDDTRERERLLCECSNRKILLIAPGKSVQMQRGEILNFISREHPYTIAINFQPDFPLDLIFVSNRKRFQTINMEVPEILFTSNVKMRPTNARTVNYSSLLNSNDYVYDNAGLMLINLLMQCGVTEVFLAGFDGFSKNNVENYYEVNQVGAVEREDLLRLTKNIESQLILFSKKVKICFLTKTSYEV